jgi:oxygen-dependent protoporphyrinogen oxidase
MIGRLNPDSREVTIVGAGISGLLAAYYLDKKGWTVHLIEADSCAGGLLSTEQSNFGIAESAAHSIPASPRVKELFEELGVKLLPINAEAKGRYILKYGVPRKFPLSIFQAVGAFLRAYFRLAPSRDPEDLTMAEWARYFLGDAGLLYLITPFTRGIFGAEPDEILVSAAFPVLCIPRGHSVVSYFFGRWIRKRLGVEPPSGVKRKVVSIPRGPISVPENGMSEWISALTKHLEERLGTRFQKNKRVDTLSEFNSIQNLIVTIPAYEASKLLQKSAPDLSEALSKVSYSPLVTATVFVDAKKMEAPPSGLGVLIPAVEGKQSLGILYNSSAFKKRVKNADTLSFTVMLGGSSHPEFLEKTDVETRKIITDELQEFFGLKGGAEEIRIKRWKNAVPKYNRHLLETWDLAEKTWCADPGRILFGNYTGQVSLRGMIELASRLPN